MPQHCPQCGHPARPGAKYCASCGRPVVRVVHGGNQAPQVSQTRDVVRIMGFWEILINSVRLFMRYFFRLFLASLVGYAVWALTTMIIYATLVGPLIQSQGTDSRQLILALLLVALPVAFINAPLMLAVSSLVVADRFKMANLVASFFGRRLFFLLLTVALQSLLVFLGSLLIIPGIYLAVAFYMTPATVMLEDRVGWGALRRSRDLVRGHWWKTFGLLSVSMSIPLMICVLVVSVLIPVASEGSLGAFTFIGALLLSTVALPIFAAVVQVLLYYDLRSRRGNFSAQSLMTVPTVRLIFERI